MILKEKCFSCYIILIDQISLSDCLYFLNYWAISVLQLPRLWRHKFWEYAFKRAAIRFSIMFKYFTIIKLDSAAIFKSNSINILPLWTSFLFIPVDYRQPLNTDCPFLWYKPMLFLSYYLLIICWFHLIRMSQQVHILLRHYISPSPHQTVFFYPCASALNSKDFYTWYIIFISSSKIWNFSSTALPNRSFNRSYVIFR